MRRGRGGAALLLDDDAVDALLDDEEDDVDAEALWPATFISMILRDFSWEVRPSRPTTPSGR